MSRKGRIVEYVTPQLGDDIGLTFVVVEDLGDRLILMPRVEASIWYQEEVAADAVRDVTDVDDADGGTR